MLDLQQTYSGLTCILVQNQAHSMSKEMKALLQLDTPAKCIVACAAMAGIAMFLCLFGGPYPPSLYSQGWQRVTPAEVASGKYEVMLVPGNRGERIPWGRPIKTAATDSPALSTSQELQTVGE